MQLTVCILACHVGLSAYQLPACTGTHCGCRQDLSFAGLQLGGGGHEQQPLLLAGVRGTVDSCHVKLPACFAACLPAFCKSGRFHHVKLAHVRILPVPHPAQKYQCPPRCCRTHAGSDHHGQPFHWVARRQRKLVSHYHECDTPPPAVDWLGSLSARRWVAMGRGSLHP